MADPVTPPAAVPAPSLAGVVPPPIPPAATTPAQVPAPNLGEKLYGAEPPVVPVADPPVGDPPVVPPAADPPVVPPVEPPVPPVDPPTPPADLVPADYKITLPEGFAPDDKFLSEFQTTSAEAKLPLDVAQKFADLGTKLVQANIDALNAQHNQTVADWVKEAEAMPEFQGELKAKTQVFLGRMMDEFGTPELRTVFDETGFGNHPHLIKMLIEMGKALMEGEPSAPGSPGNLAGPTGRRAGQTLGERLYGSSPTS